MVQEKSHRASKPEAHRRPAYANSDVKKYIRWKETQEIRKKQHEVSRYKKAAALRKYSRLCKRENIESDRVHIGAKVQHDRNSKVSNGKKNPFDNATKSSQKVKDDKNRAIEEHNRKLQEIDEAKKLREEKRRKHMARTKRGQPLLNERIAGILKKLQTPSE